MARKAAVTVLELVKSDSLLTVESLPFSKDLVSEASTYMRALSFKSAKNNNEVYSCFILHGLRKKFFANYLAYII